MKQTKTMKFFVGVLMAIPALMATDAQAGGFRSNYNHHSYHVARPVTVIRPAPRVIYAPRTVVYRSNYYRPVAYQPAYYGPASYRPVVYYNGIRAHYHYGYDTPCFDTRHTSGIYWDIGFRPSAWGVSFSTGW